MTKDVVTESSSKPVSLHPAYSVTNIQTKIRTLDGTKVTYSSWVKLFRLHAVAYKVSQHIDGTPAPTPTAVEHEAWKELDALVLQWIYSTVSDDLLVRILDNNTTTHAAWAKLEKIFLSNKKARAAALETKFCNLTLSACSSVDDYCQRLTDLANQLADVDQPVSESRLVLQLVRGLPEEYNTTASLINQQGVDWDQAITMLHDEVIRIEARKGSSSTILAAPTVTSQSAPNTNNNTGQQSFSSDPNSYTSRGRGRGRGSWNRRGRGRGNGRNQYPHNTQYSQNTNNWAGHNTPYPNWAWWTPPPCPYPTQNTWRPNTFNNHPSAPPQQAHFSGTQAQFAAYTDPTAHTACPPQQGNYNALSPSDLSAALNNLQVNQPGASWNMDVMDTGAGSHVTLDPGSQN